MWFSSSLKILYLFYLQPAKGKTTCSQNSGHAFFCQYYITTLVYLVIPNCNVVLYFYSWVSINLKKKKKAFQILCFPFLFRLFFLYELLKNSFFALSCLQFYKKDYHTMCNLWKNLFSTYFYISKIHTDCFVSLCNSFLKNKSFMGTNLYCASKCYSFCYCA